MKSMFKSLVVAVLAHQVKRLRKKNQFKIVGVVGGIGKTSTKLAIAHTLQGAKVRVRWQEGNYNDIVSVPLVFFGHTMPSLLNPFAWLGIFLKNAGQIHGKYPYDVVVVELGTDAPGQIAAFKRYLELDTVVVTSIVAEHMQNFADLNAVADEELSTVGFSKQVVFNADFVASEYRAKLPPTAISYGINANDSMYHLANIFESERGLEADVKNGGEILLHLTQEVVSEVQLYSVLAAIVIAHGHGLKSLEIKEGLTAMKPVNGRLRRLRGINNSTIIDDTYNASPEAMKAGLAALYKMHATQKIAILGNMNELGAMSASAHKEIGELCDPSKLALVVTIGPDANTHLAAAAEAKGCLVKKFSSPYDAGEYVASKIEPGALIFAKGSQNKVFAEEAIKRLLADPEDANKLIRQSPRWLKKKQQAFKSA